MRIEGRRMEELEVPLSYVLTVLGRTPVRWMASCSSFFTAAIAASPTTLMTHTQIMHTTMVRPIMMCTDPHHM